MPVCCCPQQITAKPRWLLLFMHSQPVNLSSTKRTKEKLVWNPDRIWGRRREEGGLGLPSFCGTTWAPTHNIGTCKLYKGGKKRLSNLQLGNPLGRGAMAHFLDLNQTNIIRQLVCRHWDTCHSCLSFYAKLKETRNNWGNLEPKSLLLECAPFSRQPI